MVFGSYVSEMGSIPGNLQFRYAPGSPYTVNCSIPGGTVDNYIVRIYRRGKDNPRLLVGLVEEVGISGKKAFNCLDDLWEILNRQESGAAKSQKYQRNKKGHMKGVKQE
jgi:hypothetical protein